MQPHYPPLTVRFGTIPGTPSATASSTIRIRLIGGRPANLHAFRTSITNAGLTIHQESADYGTWDCSFTRRPHQVSPDRRRSMIIYLKTYCIERWLGHYLISYEGQ